MDQRSPHSEYQQWVRRLAARAREATARSFEILKQDVPDTFLGRKTQELFPNEEKHAQPHNLINRS
jgi:hypothetical protein